MASSSSSTSTGQSISTRCVSNPCVGRTYWAPSTETGGAARGSSCSVASFRWAWLLPRRAYAAAPTSAARSCGWPRGRASTDELDGSTEMPAPALYVCKCTLTQDVVYELRASRTRAGAKPDASLGVSGRVSRCFTTGGGSSERPAEQGDSTCHRTQKCCLILCNGTSQCERAHCTFVPATLFRSRRAAGALPRRSASGAAAVSEPSTRNAYATAAAYCANTSPGSGTSRRHVTAIGCSPSCDT